MGDSFHNDTFSGNPAYRFLTEEMRELHLLREPHGYAEGMAFGNLAYQMRYSVESLELQLREEGAPHVLQLSIFWHNESQEPTRWHLYADGYEVAAGTGSFARQCFEGSAEKFRDVCREAVAAASLPTLDERDYRILDRARAIAATEG